MKNSIQHFMIISRIVILLLFIFPSISNAAEQEPSVIIDAEIQNVLEDIARPIFKAANLKNPIIYVLNNPTANAFTNGGERIFINTGLITKFNNVDVIRGVIAHEVGHVKEGHVARIQENISKSQKFSTTSLLFGLLGAVATGQPELALQGGIIGAHVAERNVLKFSRENETAADLLAVKYLEKSGFDNRGLITILEFFKDHSNLKYYNSYELTHPISIERINNLKGYNKKSSNPNDGLIQKEFEFASAKLLAFTSDKPNFSKYNVEAQTYGKAVSAMVKSDKAGAIKNMDILLEKQPDSPYFNQLKAEIYTVFGDKAGIKYYEKAIELLPNPIIKVELALARIKLSNNKEEIKKAISTLEMSLNSFNYNYVLLNFLSIAYDKIGDQGYSLYYRALNKKDQGNIKQAKKIAASAKDFSKYNESLLLKIDDILNSEE